VSVTLTLYIAWGLLAGAIGCAALSLLAAYQQRRGRSLGATASTEIEWDGTYTQAFQRALNLLALIDAELLAADADRGTILAATGLSVFTFGSTVRILLRTQEGVTHITVEAAPSISLVDWGASRRLVNSFRETWDRLPDAIVLEA
jgi:hypothetical protein